MVESSPEGITSEVILRLGLKGQVISGNKKSSLKAEGTACAEQGVWKRTGIFTE